MTENSIIFIGGGKCSRWVADQVDLDFCEGNAVKYIRRLEELTKLPVTVLSTSPERDGKTFAII